MDRQTRKLKVIIFFQKVEEHMHMISREMKTFFKRWEGHLKVKNKTI